MYVCSIAIMVEVGIICTLFFSVYNRSEGTEKNTIVLCCIAIMTS